MPCVLLFTTLAQGDPTAHDIVTIGVTNQHEAALPWNRRARRLLDPYFSGTKLAALDHVPGARSLS